MKKLLVCLGWLLLSLASAGNLQAAEYAYDDLFTPDRLRIDLIFGGNDHAEYVYLSGYHHEADWSGPKKGLVEPFGYGDYVYELRFQDETVFSKGFNSLFREWTTTAEAQEMDKAMTTSLWVPYPKEKMELVVYRRSSETGQLVQLYQTTIDPQSKIIRHGKQNDWNVYTVQEMGDPENHVDLVFVAEGYTAEEMDKFRADCHRFTENLFAMEPYSQYREAFNIRAVESVSKDTGTDLPHQDIWKQTVLNTHFYTFYSDRYLTIPDQTLAASLVSNTPCDALYIIVNTDVYGGGGIYNYYGLSMSDGKYSAEVFVHEFGHSFANLGDEYYDNSTSYDEFFNLSIEPHVPNVTSLVNFESKWKDMLPEDCPIPTPETEANKNRLGVYEGGGYMARGLYRPWINCRMKTNHAEGFCPVCQRAIVRMIEHYTR